MTGRPPGPIRKYTIVCEWPTLPGRWWSAVREVDEKTARRSATMLLRMHHGFRVSITFREANKQRNLLGEYAVAQWAKDGSVQVLHPGEMAQYMPPWTLGAEPLEREKADEPEREHQRRGPRPSAA